MAELHEIHAWMRRPAELLATRATEQWAGRVGCLLEALDEHAQGRETPNFLQWYAQRGD